MRGVSRKGQQDRWHWAGLARASFVALLAACPTTAQATHIYSNTTTCTTLNCSTTDVSSVMSGEGNQTRPWVIHVWGVLGRCVRVSLDTQQADLQMVVVGPAPGDRWRNDDGGETVCPTCPVVKFVAQKSGFYTVIVTPKTGQPTSSSFRFRYGQYNNGNINCQNPTPKL